MREVKAFPLNGRMEDNRLTGAASVTGCMDLKGDVIYPGAFSKGVLKEFLVNGFVPVGHDYEGLPVAYPIFAQENGNRLECEAEFHSTEAAQEARAVCMERMAAGLSVGLSIGFMLDYDDGCAWFSNGAALLDHAKGLGCDMSLFDSKAIKAHGEECRAIFAIERLFEFSIVCVPANPKALATQVKTTRPGGMPAPLEFGSARQLEWYLRDAGISRRQAVAIANHGYRGLLQRDSEGVTEPATTTEPDPEAHAEEPQAEHLAASQAPVIDETARFTIEARFRMLDTRLDRLRAGVTDDE